MKSSSHFCLEKVKVRRSGRILDVAKEDSVAMSLIEEIQRGNVGAAIALMNSGTHGK